MNTSSQYLLYLSFVFYILFSAGCVDCLEPAGPAQYVNPDYPSELYGYAVMSTHVSGGFSFDGRVYILDREYDLIESFSLSDNHLDFSPIPVAKDTLSLTFNPGSFVLDRQSGTLFLEDADAHNIYSVQLPDQSPELLYETDSFISSIFLADGNSALVVSFLGPEWVVKKIDCATGSVLGEFPTDWPITRSAISTDTSKLLVSNPSKYYLLEIDINSMELIDTLHLSERSGPFLYNTAGNIVVFNQYAIDPKVYLYDGNSGELIDWVNTINPYQKCCIIPGTDVVIALRRSDNRVSILNSGNMIFAPSLFCPQTPGLAFSTQDCQTIVVLSTNSGRVYVYSHQ